LKKIHRKGTKNTKKKKIGKGRRTRYEKTRKYERKN